MDIKKELDLVKGKGSIEFSDSANQVVITDSLKNTINIDMISFEKALQGWMKEIGYKIVPVDAEPKQEEVQELEIFTDGATSGNGTPDAVGGYGYVHLIDGDEIARGGDHDSGKDVRVTSPRMELRGVILGTSEALLNLDKINNKHDNNIKKFLIKCDNDYVMKGIQDPTRARNKNKDLWGQWDMLVSEMNFLNINYEAKWIKGHNGTDTYDGYWNDVVDRIAVKYKQL